MIKDVHLMRCFFVVVFSGKQSEFCMICELEKHIKRVFERSGDVVAPHSILGKMKSKSVGYSSCLSI